jgi:small subunit ribosomal protein S21
LVDSPNPVTYPPRFVLAACVWQSGKTAYFKHGKRGEIKVAEIKLGDNETMESALRRFKRKVQTEDIIREVKRHAFFIPPGEKARLKSQLARKRNRKKVRRVFDA